MAAVPADEHKATLNHVAAPLHTQLPLKAATTTATAATTTTITPPPPPSLPTVHAAPPSTTQLDPVPSAASSANAEMHSTPASIPGNAASPDSAPSVPGQVANGLSPSTPATSVAPSPAKPPAPASPSNGRTLRNRETLNSSSPAKTTTTTGASPNGKASSSSRSRRQRIEPDHFYPLDPNDEYSWQDPTGVPVFKPTMEQFADFEGFCEAIDAWGMQSGIVKIIPPKEWSDALPTLRASEGAEEVESAGPHGMKSSTIESVRIRNAITQHWQGAGSGVWRQQNVVHPARMWNTKQWAETCASAEKRGPDLSRMRANAQRTSDEAKHAAAGRSWADAAMAAALAEANESAKAPGAADKEDDGVRTRSGRGKVTVDTAVAVKPRKSLVGLKRKRADGSATPTGAERSEGKAAGSADGGGEVKAEDGEEAKPTSVPTSTSPERRSLRSEAAKAEAAASKPPTPAKVVKVHSADKTTPEEWAAFDYETGWTREGMRDEELRELEESEGRAMEEQEKPRAAVDGEEATIVTAVKKATPEDWDPITCREIENEYWRGLNFGQPPMYGADLKGTLFTPDTTAWNVGNLPNLLNRLRLKRKLPGVTTPYLYFGMWRATFAWHLEDMDLYSINFIRFGAPKQWYAIRQADRQRFETAMASAFPLEAGRCKHFMRHKSFLASPAFLRAHNIRPVKLVQHAREFVITYPYGYHSGFNLGFNCAESVNFALESWLPIGRRAGWCECEDHTVRMDVDAILRESDEIVERERRREERAALLAKQEEEGDAMDAAEREADEARKARRRELDRMRRQRAREEAEEAEREAERQAELAANPRPKKRSRPSQKAEGELSAKQGPAATSESSDDEEERFCSFCPLAFSDGLLRVASSKPHKHGLFAHLDCAHFTPECYFEADAQTGEDVVQGYDAIPRQRWALKCSLCDEARFQKQGVKVQCTFGKCARAVHVGCAKMLNSGWYLADLGSERAGKLQGRSKAPQEDLLSIVRRAQAELQATVDAAANGEEPPATAEDAGGDLVQVVLCTLHNPLEKARAEERRLKTLRLCAMTLKEGDLVRVNESGSQWQITVIEVKEPVKEGEEGTVVVQEKFNVSAYRWSQVVFDEALRAEMKAKVDAEYGIKAVVKKPTGALSAARQADAVVPPVTAAALAAEAADVEIPTKRQRARKSRSAADEASEKAPQDAAQLAAPKKTRKRSSKAAETTGATPLSVTHPANGAALSASTPEGVEKPKPKRVRKPKAAAPVPGAAARAEPNSAFNASEPPVFPSNPDAELSSLPPRSLIHSHHGGAVISASRSVSHASGHSPAMDSPMPPSMSGHGMPSSASPYSMQAGFARGSNGASPMPSHGEQQQQHQSQILPPLRDAGPGAYYRTAPSSMASSHQGYTHALAPSYHPQDTGAWHHAPSYALNSHQQQHQHQHQQLLLTNGVLPASQPSLSRPSSAAASKFFDGPPPSQTMSGYGSGSSGGGSSSVYNQGLQDSDRYKHQQQPQQQQQQPHQQAATPHGYRTTVGVQTSTSPSSLTVAAAAYGMHHHHHQQALHHLTAQQQQQRYEDHLRARQSHYQQQQLQPSSSSSSSASTPTASSNGYYGSAGAGRVTSYEGQSHHYAAPGSQLYHHPAVAASGLSSIQQQQQPGAASYYSHQQQQQQQQQYAATSGGAGSVNAAQYRHSYGQPPVSLPRQVLDGPEGPLAR